MNVGTAYKAASEVITRTVDFSNDLQTGETLSTIQSIVALTIPDGTDATSTIIGPTPASIIGNTVQFQMENGTTNDFYGITITVTTSLSNVYQASITLIIGMGINLTTLANVKGWLGIAPGTTSDDIKIQDCITAFSAYVIHATGRGPMDGSYPTQSPFVNPVTYTDTYDGSGTVRQPIRNWPITSVASVNISGQAIQQSTSINTWGWVVDGDGRFISLRGGINPNVATFQNYRYQGYVPFGPGFSAGVQNVQITYTAGFFTVPVDLEMAARKTVALNYSRKGWIGQRSQAMAQGAGTVSFGTWEMDQDCANTIFYYRRQNV